MMMSVKNFCRASPALTFKAFGLFRPLDAATSSLAKLAMQAGQTVRHACMNGAPSMLQLDIVKVGERVDIEGNFRTACSAFSSDQHLDPSSRNRGNLVCCTLDRAKHLGQLR